jgi:hypothetical protein
MSSPTPLTPEQRKKRFTNIVSGVLLCIIGFFAAPVIVTTIKGILGLLVCVVVLGIAWALVQPFIMFLANLKMKAIKAEAWRNPTETLRSEQQKRHSALDAARETLEQMKGRIKAFRGTLADLKPRISREKYNEMFNVAAQLDALYTNRLGKYENARVKLLEFGNLIEQAEAEWQVSCAARDATAAFNTGDDALSQLKVGASLTAIRTNLGAAMAALDTELADSNAEARIMTGQAAENEVQPSTHVGEHFDSTAGRKIEA